MNDIEFIWVKTVIVLGIGCCRRHHLADWSGGSVGQKLQNRQRLSDLAAFDGIRYQAHLAWWNANISGNCSHFHWFPLVSSPTARLRFFRSCRPHALGSGGWEQTHPTYDPPYFP